MKRILFWLLITTLWVPALRAQESAAQQQIEELNGRIQTLIEGQAAQGKRLDAMAREISELREKVNTPQANDYANREDVKRLAEKVQELASKQQADKELILENIKQLGKTFSDVPSGGSSTKKKKPSTPKTDEAKADTKADELPKADVTGFPYKVQQGDSLGLIVKAFRDKGVKVTTAQVLKANPGLDADKLYVGKTIIIPDPTAK